MLKKNLYLILLLLLIIDIPYSFKQHLNIELDGDMADLILPSQWNEKVFEDPLGLNVLLKNEIYAGPNRFFSHWIYSKYFKLVPGILQNAVNPIDSIYIACAIAKTAIQVFIIFLLAAYISGKKNIFSKEFLVAAILVTPFFITNQYWRLGIIDWSITFTFFYALPLCLLMLFFLPFFKKLFHGEKIKTNFFYKIYMILLLVIISLSGAIIPGIILIVCPVILLHLWYFYFKEQVSLLFIRRFVFAFQKIPREIVFYFILAIVLSAYSLFIGRNNIENIITEVTLMERYKLLPLGFVKLFDQMSLGTPLVIMVLINTVLIMKYFNKSQGKKILSLSKWILICSFIYILLLPLGGFRSYRPYILRYDTVMPITLSLILIFGLSTYFLTFNLSGKFKIIFSSVIIIFLMVYIYEDKPTNEMNKCQRKALYEISQSKDTIVTIGSDCNVMSWDKIKDYKESELNAELLKYWRVTKEKKLYYQK